MIPTIEKIDLNDHELSKIVKLELKIMDGMPNTIRGYKFWHRDKKCVVVGINTHNDFDLWRTAADIGGYLEKIEGVEVEKFRFAFI